MRNTLTDGDAALHAPLLHELSICWVRSLPSEALDLLDARCPHWQSVTVANGKVKYVNVGHGKRLIKEEAQVEDAEKLSATPGPGCS